MLELRDETGNPRRFKLTSAIDSKRCPICGQYMKNGEEYYIVVCNSSNECREARIANQMPHADCWDNFCHDIADNATLVETLKTHRKPRARALTNEDTLKVEAFKRATTKAGFFRYTMTKTGATATKPRTTMTLTYNVYTDKIHYTDRRKGGLFDAFFIREIEAKIRNEMNSILGNGAQMDKFSAEKAIKGVFNDVQKMMG